MMVKRIKLCLGIFLLIAVALIAYTLADANNKAQSLENARKQISNMIIYSKGNNNKKYIDCFIKEHQKSLQLYLKENPKGKPWKYNYVKLLRIKEIKTDIYYKNFISYSGFKSYMYIYTEILTQINNNKNNNDNLEKDYFNIGLAKEHSQWKIIYIYPADMYYVTRNKLGFNDAGEKAAAKKQQRELVPLIDGGINDYRNILIPKYNSKLSYTYMKPYKELKKELLYARVKKTDDNGAVHKGYTIRNKSALINIVKGFDKLKCQVPTINNKQTTKYEAGFVICMWRKGRSVSFVVSKFDSAYFYEELDMPRRKMSKYLVKLCKLR